MTWEQLERAARSDRLRLFRSTAGITIFTTDAFEVPLVSIQIGELTDEDADKTLKKLTQHALKLLKEFGT